MDEKILIKKINNLVSNEIIYNDQLKFDKELASMVNMYTVEDIESLIRYTSENDISILNDISVTKEFNNLLENLLNKKSIELNVTNMSRLINKLYEPKNINFSYRQHCNEIFILLLNAILDNTYPDEYVYELLYEKLLVNQLNSRDTINDLIDNDLNRYIQQEKIILVRESIKDLLIMNNICCIDDMKICINDIKQKLNIINDFDLNLSNKDDCNKEDILEELDTDEHKGINMTKKKKINLNDSEFSENDKETMEDDLENIEETSNDMEPDDGFSAEDLEQENLSLKRKVKLLNRRLKKSKGINLSKSFLIDEDLGDTFGMFDQKDDAIKEIHKNCRYEDISGNSGFWEWSKYSPENLPDDNDYISEEDAKYFVIETENEELSNLSKKGKQTEMKRRRNLNSITIEDGKEDNVNEITELTQEQPSEMKEDDLNGDVKQVAIELSKLRKIVMSLAAKTEEAINLSQRESALNRGYIQLSESASELEEMVDDLDKNEENLEDYAEEQENIEEREAETQEVNNSRRSRFDRDVSYKSTNVNMSAAKTTVKARSALDIMMSRR